MTSRRRWWIGSWVQAKTNPGSPSKKCGLETKGSWKFVRKPNFWSLFRRTLASIPGGTNNPKSNTPRHLNVCLISTPEWLLTLSFWSARWVSLLGCVPFWLYTARWWWCGGKSPVATTRCGGTTQQRPGLVERVRGPRSNKVGSLVCWQVFNLRTLEP